MWAFMQLMPIYLNKIDVLQYHIRCFSFLFKIAEALKILSNNLGKILHNIFFNKMSSYLALRVAIG